MVYVHFLINKLNIEHIIALGGKKINENWEKIEKQGNRCYRFTGRHFWNRKCRKKNVVAAGIFRIEMRSHGKFRYWARMREQ